MADFVFNYFKKRMIGAAIAGGTLKLMLGTAAHVPNRAVPDFINDLAINEITNDVGNAYVAGGKAITNPTLTQDDTDNEGVLDGDDVVWDVASFTARYGWLYVDMGTPATSPVIGELDFGLTRVVSNGTFSIVWGAEGILNVT